MAKSITVQIRDLQEMTIPELRARYAEVFGDETRSHHKQHLFRKIAWRIQELAEGGLSERAKTRAREIANEADIRTRPPQGFLPDSRKRAKLTPTRAPLRDPRLPVPGTVLEREYRGHAVSVRVLEKGFEYEGRAYRSLSAVAREITGTNWNGMLFFGLNKAKATAQPRLVDGGKRGER